MTVSSTTAAVISGVAAVAWAFLPPVDEDAASKWAGRVWFVVVGPCILYYGLSATGGIIQILGVVLSPVIAMLAFWQALTPVLEAAGADSSSDLGKRDWKRVSGKQWFVTILAGGVLFLIAEVILTSK
jgi:hypothetical protein